jgi:hypothetical protein
MAEECKRRGPSIHDDLNLSMVVLSWKFLRENYCLYPLNKLQSALTPTSVSEGDAISSAINMRLRCIISADTSALSMTSSMTSMTFELCKPSQFGTKSHAAISMLATAMQLIQPVFSLQSIPRDYTLDKTPMILSEQNQQQMRIMICHLSGLAECNILWMHRCPN